MRAVAARRAAFLALPTRTFLLDDNSPRRVMLRAHL